MVQEEQVESQVEKRVLSEVSLYGLERTHHRATTGVI